MAISANVKYIMEAARTQTLRTVSGLTEEQFIREPEEFSNNILWNCGHLAYAQAALVYRPAGRPLPIPEEYASWFDTGSAPSRWERIPDVKEVVDCLQSLNDTILADHKAGKLRKYRGFELFPGLKIGSLDDALTFACFHEGIHQGIIMSLKRFV